MQLFHQARLLICTFLLVIFSATCSGQPPINTQSNLDVYNNVASEVSLRPWETEGLGKVIAKETLTVIKTKDGKGEVVVLRWLKDQSQFVTEVYRGDPEAQEHSSWTLANGQEKKTLAHQHGDLYMIHQLVAGKDGGQRSEIFKLARK
jgi:hypothetical protein